MPSPCAVLLLAATTTFAPMTARAQSAEGSDSAFVRVNYVKHEYRIPMRDGVRLFTAVYVPNDAGDAARYPIVLQRTP